MKISIVTLNYNGSKETLELLKSLKDQTLRPGSGQADPGFEIIVVDNASEEADFTNLKEIPQIIRNSANLGFSGGNNVGIRAALGWNNDSDPAKSPRGDDNGASWVVLLNNDTWVERDFMERLKAILGAKDGVVGIP